MRLLLRWTALVVVLSLGLVTGVVLAQNTANYMEQGGATWVVGGTLNATTGSLLVANGAAPPATCTVGQIFIDTDETDDTNCTTTADNSICVCHATNTWATTE